MTQATYVVDTHTLAFWFGDDRRLSVGARAIFEQAETENATIVVPLLVLAELAWMIEKGKMQVNVQDLIRQLRAHPSFIIASLEESALDCFLAATGIGEMHDRFIACEAKLRNASLITRDKNIHASGFVPVIW